jgi:(E)-4-hydroxy-3-methylbut-2-enyl-diphosphate synthase
VVTPRRKWVALAHKLDKLGDFQPEIVLEESGVVEIDPQDDGAVAALAARPEPALVTVRDGIGLEVIPAFRLLAARIESRHPILLKDVLERAEGGGKDFLETLLTAARHLGSLICDGIGDAVLVQGEEAPGQSLRLSYNILQASGARRCSRRRRICASSLRKRRSISGSSGS